MALLVIDLDRRIGNQQVWRDTFADQLPDLEVRFWPDAGASADIEYLAFMRPNFDLLPDFPKLKAMFSRTAGAEEFINHPRLPRVPLGKIEPDSQRAGRPFREIVNETLRRGLETGAQPPSDRSSR
jgi:glyoxylate/hydroxypyruvate reductase